MSRRARIAVWILVVFVAIGAYGWFFGVPTMFMAQARYWGWKDPLLWKIPVPLRDQAISTSPGLKLSYLGYEFEVPWDDVDEER
ncbi:MAG TPA: hypothetical protein VEF03_00470, partial [Candidatus Binataceae bacterium]|nr:hypothetical protein [Candidatus Binataceae bacterium]